MIPSKITRDNVLAAILIIDQKGVPRDRESKDFHVIFEGKTYPPKYLISLASREAVGRILKPEEFSGGTEANEFLRKLGFEVQRFPAHCVQLQIKVARAWLDMGVSMTDFR